MNYYSLIIQLVAQIKRLLRFGPIASPEAEKTGNNYILINCLRSSAIRRGYPICNVDYSNIFDCLFMMRFTVITNKSHKGQSSVQWFSLC